MFEFFNKTLKGFFGTKIDRDMKEVIPLTDKINPLYENLASLSNDELRQKTIDFKNTINDFIADIEKELEELTNQAENEPDMEMMEKKNDLDQLRYLRLIGTTIAATSSLPIPLRGDMKRLIDSIIKIKKKQQREKNKGGSKVGILTEPAEGEIPQYELPEYDYSPQDLNLP